MPKQNKKNTKKKKKKTIPKKKKKAKGQGPCWKGYKKKKGMKNYENGSCVKA